MLVKTARAVSVLTFKDNFYSQNSIKVLFFYPNKLSKQIVSANRSPAGRNSCLLLPNTAEVKSMSAEEIGHSTDIAVIPVQLDTAFLTKKSRGCN